jgi:alanine racemase
LNTWIEISAEHLAGNLQTLQAAVGDRTDLLAVIKANAYGHGAERCAVILAQAGAGWLGVTCAEEGARVRKTLTAAGLAPDILVMSGFLPADVALLAEYGLTPVAWTTEQVATLKPGTAVHVEVDTAMSRQGVQPGPALAALLARMAQGGVKLDGIFTHFASSEEADSTLTQMQQRRFEEAIEQVREAGLKPRSLHAGNSSTIDNPAQSTPWLAKLAECVGARAMARPGLALYGYCLGIDGQASPHVRPELRPVMTWKARVLTVRELAVGESVGYNATYTATHPMRIALLPVGYADGLRRELSSTTSSPGGWVMLHGQRAPILGRVSMNLTVVDVTGIQNAQPGDEAIVLGAGITADDHAAMAGTVAYEILCGVHPCG